jgi:putative phosphoesterase
MVAGNCDFFCRDYPETLVLSLEQHRILLTHGHRFGVKEGLSRPLMHAVAADADVVIFGQTHEPLLRTVAVGSEIGGRVLEKPIYLFNPGSIGMGRHSFGTLSLRPDLVFFSHGEL